MKQNKFYIVFDVSMPVQFYNVVIASSAKEAKYLGSYANDLEHTFRYTDIRVRAVREGMRFGYYSMKDKRLKTVLVTGKGFVYTHYEKGLVDTINDDINLFDELKRLNRAKILDDIIISKQ
jgi:hypothetical protein